MVAGGQLRRDRLSARQAWRPTRMANRTCSGALTPHEARTPLSERQRRPGGIGCADAAVPWQQQQQPAEAPSTAPCMGLLVPVLPQSLNDGDRAAAQQCSASPAWCPGLPCMQRQSTTAARPAAGCSQDLFNYHEPDAAAACCSSGAGGCGAAGRRRAAGFPDGRSGAGRGVDAACAAERLDALHSESCVSY